jgi:NADH dehydrogenase
VTPPRGPGFQGTIESGEPLSTLAEPGASRPKVLVLGGGFAGVGAARKLKDADVEVVLVDKHDYHTFQPLPYRVASDLLEPSTVGHPLRDLFDEQPNARVHQDTVTGVDLERREAQFEKIAPIRYDYLVLALGAHVNFFGTEGSEQYAFPMYTLADALRLKEHILRNWEAADRDPSLVEDGILNVVVGGGGPTGVETASGIADLYRDLFVSGRVGSC